MGSQLIAPALRSVGAPPQELGASVVTFPSESGSLIHAWYAVGRPGAGAVLLLHGVGADRSAMTSRAVFLHALGYSVLLIDFQAHGESPGKHITAGYLESRDAAAAAEYLHRTLPQERLGVIGLSMGAAAIVLAQKPLPLSAVVLESMYPTIEEAIGDRMKLALGRWGPALAPLLLLQLKPRIGVGPSQMHPIDCIADLGAPLLLIHGSEDQHTTPDEARRVFAAAAEPKTFWEVPGAGHVDMDNFAKAEYERRVSAFLASYLARR